MKIDDIEISFGKSTLVEKTQRVDFLHLVDSLCQEVPGSFLHCNMTGTGWVTIIRYSKLKENEDYCLLRIILLKNIKSEKIDITELNLRNALYVNSHREQPYSFGNCGICVMDSMPIICYKETLPVMITEIMTNLIEIVSFHIDYRLSFVLTEITSPFAFCNMPNHCVSLYGTHYIMFDLSPIGQPAFDLLKHNVNKWKIKLKRKGRRLLKKNLTLKPI